MRATWRRLLPSMPTNNVGDGDPYVQISLLTRTLTYLFLLGIIMIIIYLVLKFLGVSNGEDQIQNTNVTPEVQTQNESEPLISPLSYGTNAADDEESSEELYDEKLCVICYDEKRNSFFVPCGHCATCYECAQRIADEESKLCPICRRLIHKVRRLFPN